MDVVVVSGPSFGMAEVRLGAGEEIVAEAGSMVAMDPGLRVGSELNGSGGGVLGWVKAFVVALARKWLAGESVFVNRYTATADGQAVHLSPAMVGDTRHIRLDGRPLFVQGSSFLAHGVGVELSTVWMGLQMLFSGEGAFFLKAAGQGDLLINAYGALEEVEVDGRFVVDTGHVVAFRGDLDWKLSRAGGSWTSTALSGEGLVMTFSGKGTLWLQTRATRSLVSWLIPLLP